jgi:hypothetical protein
VPTWVSATETETFSQWARREAERAARVARRRAEIERFYVESDQVIRYPQPPARPVTANPLTILRDEADKRARALLLSVLNAEQRAMFGESRCFRVVSNLGTVFVLFRQRTHGVFKLDAQGNKVEEWCVTPNGRIPLDDVLVMQKLALETDELALRAQANVWVLTGSQRGQMVHRAPSQYDQYSDRPDYLRELAAG